MKRPKIINIRVELDNEEVYDINPEDYIALFWGDLKINNLTNEPSVTGILGTFYDTLRKPIEISRKDFEKEFSKEFADNFYKTRDEDEMFKLNKEFVQHFWNNEDEKGKLRAFVAKKPECFVGNL